MSKVEVDQVDPQSGTTLTLGTSGDTVSIPSGVTLANAGTVTGIPASAISSGTIATARLGSGTASGTTFLAGDQTYKEAGGGKVLQVITANKTSQASSNSTSFTDAGLSLAITPSASSSKIYLVFTTNGRCDNSAAKAAYTILRGSTVLSTADGFAKINNADNIVCPVSASFLDAPSTTSETTYKIQSRGS